MHPFVAKKLSTIRNVTADERVESLMTALLWSRSGRASVDEALDILG
ncbi:hypothetical protein GF380_06270 [Candidatus Uhrbacteria bacterium]|nr:hypothetical protein [Candidatus Uhrbacteria bacterium]